MADDPVAVALPEPSLEEADKLAVHFTFGEIRQFEDFPGDSGWISAIVEREVLQVRQGRPRIGKLSRLSEVQQLRSDWAFAEGLLTTVVLEL
jgi:hypothetical protein